MRSRTWYISFVIISIIALFFGYWFASCQLNAVSPQALSSYPKVYLSITILKCYFTVLAFFGFAGLLFSRLFGDKLNPLYLAATYLPLFLLYLQCSLLCVTSLILVLQVSYLICTMRKKDYRMLGMNYSVDFLVLVVFFLLNLFLTTAFSPLHWNMALLASIGYYGEETYVLAPVFKGFVLAKQFSLTNIDHSQWAGIMNPPITLASPFMQMLALVFNSPSASYQSFHVILMTIYFILAVLGSFGFYLFLNYAAKLQKIFAFVGGFLYFFSGSPFLYQVIVNDGGVFISSFAVFPYALMLISLAFEKNTYRLAAWAGLALAAQFFFLTPHPEGVIFSLLFYGLYVFGLIYFSPRTEIREKIRLSAFSIVIFFLLAAYSFVPILVDRVRGDMYVFAHTGDISATPLHSFIRYFIMLVIAAPLSLWLQRRRKKISIVYLSTLFLSVCLLLLILLTTRVHLMKKLVHVFHIGLHFWYYWRIGMYFYLSVLIIVIFVLQQVTELCWELIKKRYPRLLRHSQ